MKEPSLNKVGYISSWDGKVSKLVVQTVDQIYDEKLTSTYRRTFIRNIAPLYLRLANWPFNHVDPNNNEGKPTSEGRLLYPSSRECTHNLVDMPMLCFKWFITAIAISCVVRAEVLVQLNSKLTEC
jgi:hypothetical protein